MTLKGDVMRDRTHMKLVHEGKYAAEVEVKLIEHEEGWSPYICVEDALKLDRVRKLLKEQNLQEAQKLAKVYLLKPIAA